MVVGQELCCLRVRFLRHVIHLGPQTGIADRQVVLGAVPRAVGAFASRLAASFVALDERTAEDRLEWRQLLQENLAAFPQSGGGLVLDFHQTTCLTGLIVKHSNTFFNLFVWTWPTLRVG